MNTIASSSNAEDSYVPPISDLPTLETAIERPRRWKKIFRTLWFYCIIALISGFVISNLDFEKTQTVAAILMGSAGAVYVYVIIPTWSWPARILLLRPFNTQDVSNALKGLVDKNVKHSGHVFTLADQHLQESFKVKIFEVLAVLAICTYGFIYALTLMSALREIPVRKIDVENAKGYSSLKKRLGCRLVLNFFWVNSFDKIRKVRTSDDWWQKCIDLLCANCEMILIDLSLVKSGTQWELAKISKENLAHKAIFVVQEDKINEARSILLQHWSNEKLPQIFPYNGLGVLKDERDFNQRVAKILSTPSPVFNGKPVRCAWRFLSLCCCWIPFAGPVTSAILWLEAWGSGRLRDLRLAKITLAFSIIITIVSMVMPGSPFVAQAHGAPTNEPIVGIQISGDTNNPYALVRITNTLAWHGVSLMPPLEWRKVENTNSVGGDVFRLGYIAKNKYLCRYELSILDPSMTEESASFIESMATNLLDSMSLTSQIKVLSNENIIGAKHPSRDVHLHQSQPDGREGSIWMRLSVVRGKILSITVIGKAGVADDDPGLRSTFEEANAIWSFDSP